MYFWVLYFVVLTHDTMVLVVLVDYLMVSQFTIYLFIFEFSIESHQILLYV